MASDFSCCPHSVSVESEAVHSLTVMLEQKVEIKTDDQNDECVIKLLTEENHKTETLFEGFKRFQNTLKSTLLLNGMEQKSLIF